MPRSKFCEDCHRSVLGEIWMKRFITVGGVGNKRIEFFTPIGSDLCTGRLYRWFPSAP